MWTPKMIQKMSSENLRGLMNFNTSKKQNPLRRRSRTPRKSKNAYLKKLGSEIKTFEKSNWEMKFPNHENHETRPLGLSKELEEMFS